MVAVVDRSESEPFEEANSKLAQGLKSCRALVNNYRSLLASGANSDGSGGQHDRAPAHFPDTDPRRA
jgi:hypothetical protein